MSKKLIVSRQKGNVFCLFVDTTEAFGPKGGLPVDNALSIIEPCLWAHAEFGASATGLVFDAHEHKLKLRHGHICMAETYEQKARVAPFVQLTPELVADWDRSYLHPGAGFTLEYFKHVYVPGVIATTGFPQTLWPVHGVDGTHETFPLDPLDELAYTFRLPKGGETYADSHSAVRNAIGFDSGLLNRIRGRRYRVDTVVLFGLERWICIAYTALDLAREGYKVYISWEGTAELVMHDPAQRQLMRDRLKKVGVKFIHLEDIKFVD
jgi:nicotinamidase-related amidase